MSVSVTSFVEVINRVNNYSIIGNATLSPMNIEYAGNTWRRLTASSPDSGGARCFANVSDLEDGKAYRVLSTFLNDTDLPVTISMDWCDVGGRSVTLGPGEETDFVFGPYARTTYTDTYRFVDFWITDPGIQGNTVLVRNVAIFREEDPYEYFDGNTPPHDGYEYRWTGTAYASTSEKRRLVFTYTPEVHSYTEEEYRSKYLDPQVKVTRRAEILESNGSTLWEGATSDPRLIGGSISVDYSRDERRSLDIELANFDRKLIHRPEGFWYDKVIRVYRGIEFRDRGGIHRHEVSLGKFMIDRTTQSRFPHTLKVTARDFTKKALQSKFTAAVSFAAGTSITTIIGALAANCGIFDRILPNTDEVLGTDTVFERGATRWEAMKKIAEAFNYEIFIDAQGYLVMRKFIDPTLGPVSHEFLTGSRVGNLVDWQKTTDDTRLFNIVSVVGTTDSGIPIRSDAINDNPVSPTSTVNIGPRVYSFDSSFVTTQEQADELSTALLAVNGLEEYEVNVSSLVTPWLEAGEIMRFSDPDAAEVDPDRFLMTSINLPIGLEAMTAVGRRVTIVGGDY